MNSFSFRIAAIRQETATVKTFMLEQKEGEVVSYQAGQFLTFLFQVNGEDIRRSYSFSSAPVLNEPISITTKRYPNGVISRLMHDTLQVGDILQSIAPAGIFTIEPELHTELDIFLIAAGTGIVPVFSLLKELLFKKSNSRITLVYSNHQQSDAVFYNELKALQQQFSHRLYIEFLFSDHQQILKARLSSTSLKLLFDRHLHFDKKKALVYTCGPYDYMQMVQIVALTYGFDTNNIRREIFTLPESVGPRPEYITTTDQFVTLLKGNDSYRFLVPFRQSILTAALDNKIELPYSCRAGRCSSCRARVLQGKVQMHYNEVLTDADEAEGYTLTCTGHPLTDDVVIAL